MKKLLLGTTALLGAIAFSGNASAQQVTGKAPFTITINGQLHTYLGVNMGGDEGLSSGLATSTGKKNYDFIHESVIQFGFAAKTDNGLTYGGQIRKYFNPQSGPQGSVSSTASVSGSGATPGGSVSVSTPASDYDRSFIYVSGSFGMVRFGDVNTARADFAPGYNSVGPSMGNGLGSDGGMAALFYNRTGVSVADGLTSLGNYPVYPGSGSSTRRTKLAYITPDFSGFQAGISFTPSPNSAGFTFDRTDTLASGASVLENNSRGAYRDVIDVSVKYTADLGAFKLIPTATYMFGSAFKSAPATRALEDVSSLYVGLAAEYGTFGAAVGYTNSFKTGLAKSIGGESLNKDDSYGLLIQAGYTMGPWAVSGYYQYAETEGNQTVSANDTMRLFELAAGYTLAPGLQMWTAIHNYEFKDDLTTQKRNGTLFLLGSTLAF